MAKQLTFTRYLYNADEVLFSFLESLLAKKDIKKTIFWISEYYYSGFKDESWKFIFTIYNWFYKEMKPKWEKKINVEYDLWLQNKGPISYLLVVINNLFSIQSSPKRFIEIAKEYYEINRINVKKENNRISWKKNKRLVNKQSKMLIEDNDMGEKAWKILKKKRKYEISNTIGCFKLDRDRDEHYIKSYLYDWEYYANFSPIWRKRIETHKGIFEGKELKFDNIDLQEKFYESYGFEPDEQDMETHMKSIRSMKEKVTMNKWLKYIYKKIDI